MKKNSALLIVVTLAFAGFTGFLNLGTMNAQGTNVSGTISADTTWNILGSPYKVVGNIIVANGATLTIDQGVDVKFDDFYSIYVEGNLTAVGNKTSRIDITSNKVIVNPGDWDRIQVNSTGHAELIYCDIKYANYAVRLESSSNNTVSHNNMLFNRYGTHLLESSYSNITYNMISSSYFDGISLDLSFNNSISNNTLSSNMEDGLYLYDSTNNTISGNEIAWNTANGLQVELSAYNRISNNSIESNGWSGISLGDSPRNVLRDNEIGPDNNKGIEFYQSSYNNLINNYVTSNENGGIHLDTSYWNNITGHNIAENGVGIYLEDTNNNTIYNNTIQINTQSIFVITSASNRIYHNDIVFNNIRASDATANNFWNDTYPSGGNYWSEYSPLCIDNHDGAITPQESGSADGICDTTYELEGNGKDYYPLKNPFRLNEPIVLEGFFDINSPQHDDLIWFGATELVEGTVYTRDFVPIAGIEVEVRLKDSSGNIWLQQTTTTMPSGFFYVEINIPEDLTPGYYQICAYTVYGDIPEECVSVYLDRDPGDIWWPGLIIPVIIIVVVLVTIIIVVVVTSRRSQQQLYDPQRHGPPLPPPPFLPPPPPPPQP